MGKDIDGGELIVGNAHAFRIDIFIELRAIETEQIVQGTSAKFGAHIRELREVTADIRLHEFLDRVRFDAEVGRD